MKGLLCVAESIGDQTSRGSSRLVKSKVGGINSSPRPLAIYSTHTRRDCDGFLRPETIEGIKAELTELLSDMSKMVSSF